MSIAWVHDQYFEYRQNYFQLKKRMVNISYPLYFTNEFTHRLEELIRDHIDVTPEIKSELRSLVIVALNEIEQTMRVSGSTAIEFQENNVMENSPQRAFLIELLMANEYNQTQISDILSTGELPND
jgi:hypothetical protein